jgi:hypothetical protein
MSSNEAAPSSASVAFVQLPCMPKGMTFDLDVSVIQLAKCTERMLARNLDRQK